ncbi:hypothetical protein [Vermiculatibacterium agrestimuris]|uniref:hypothetical protein n=1 Tax=Vermiculatibacterium agrestimuris TaxID=2941519 RepID=UPI00203C2FEF|nr:hypothetical protein [Vermiculatibacterium agrestimuris]
MKPILFNSEMVRAILDGRKTVTRRVVKEPWYIEDETVSKASGLAMHKGSNCTYGMPYPDSIYRPGEILYVRETFFKAVDRYMYKANYSDSEKFYRNGKVVSIKWHPSIHMPKEAARLFLRVKAVRIEKLRAMGMEDALMEGITPINRPGGCKCQFAVDGCMEEPCPNRAAYETYRHMDPFIQLWDSTIAPADRAFYGWEANPWVWVIGFERVTKEEAEDGDGA